MRELFPFLPAQGPIPPEFHTECGDGPFEKCGVCGSALSSRVGYSLIKEHQRERCIFEFAICFDCSDDLAGCLSEDSEARLREWFDHAELGNDPGACTFCGVEAVTLERLSTRLICRGDEWIAGPEVCCHDCEATIESLLSKETKGDYGDWFKEHIPGLPSSEIDLEALLTRL